MEKKVTQQNSNSINSSSVSFKNMRPMSAKITIICSGQMWEKVTPKQFKLTKFGETEKKSYPKKIKFIKFQQSRFQKHETDPCKNYTSFISSGQTGKKLTEKNQIHKI